MNPYTKKTVSGFTLVELLIVVIILAILAAIVVPQFASSTDDAKDSALDSTLANMRAAIDLYYQQHKNVYPGAAAANGTLVPCGGNRGTGAAGTKAAFLDQLSLYTDASGNTCTKKTDSSGKVLYPYGPYIKKRSVPKNPVNNKPDMKYASTGNLDLSGQVDGATGWLYDDQTGKFIANDSSTDINGVKYSEH